MKIAWSIGTVVNVARWVLRGQGGTAATVQTLLSRLLILALNVATGVITARALGPEGRGEQAAMSLWPQFLAYTMTLGLPSALLYNLKRHPEEQSKLLSAALLMGTGLGLVASVTGIVFIPQWLAQYSAEAIHYAQWFMILAPLILVSTAFIAALEAEGKFTLANRLRYLMPLTTLAVISGLALTKTLTPFTAVPAYILPGPLIAFWLLAHFWNHFHFSWRGLGRSYKLLTSYGVRSYGIEVLNLLALQVDQVLVIGLLTPASMGMYVVTLNLSRMVNILQNAIVTVLFPKTVARPAEEVVALTGRAARLSIVLLFPVAIGVMLFGSVLLRLLYGPEFLGAVSVLRLLVLEAIISGLVWILAQAFMALGRPGTATILQGLGLGLGVPMMLVLIPTYGLEGTGLALLGSTTVRLVFVLVSYPLLLKVRPPSLLVTREDWHFLKKKIFQEI